jgi:hypothetical protein
MFVSFWSSVVFPDGVFVVTLVKLERDADVELPIKVTNDNNAMIAPMAMNILSFTVGIFVNGIYID